MFLGRKHLQFSHFLGLLFVLTGFYGRAQTNPQPFQITPAIPFQFTTSVATQWLTTSGAGNYPKYTPPNIVTAPAASCNAIWHRCGVVHPALLDPTIGDYISAYTSSTSAAIIGSAGRNGFTFSNFAATTDENLGAFVVGLNTTGMQNVTVKFDVKSQSVGLTYNIRLQYRTSPAATWQNVNLTDEYVGTGLVDPLWTTKGPYVLPAAANNRANMQIRWKYYCSALTPNPASNGQRIGVAADSVYCTAIGTNAIATGGVTGSPFCVTPTAGAAINVPICYYPAANYPILSTFTVQLSDAFGSFAAPTAIGSTFSSGTGSQVIPVTIPANTPSGTGYRIRVVSTVATPNLSDNDQDLTIKLSPTNVTSPASTCGIGSSTVSWTLPTTSCYDEVMVVAYPAVPTVGSPSGNGLAYTANAAYGLGTVFNAGYVVFIGTGTSVNVSNLTNGTLYYFKIWVRYGTDWTSGVEVSCTPDLTGTSTVLINGYFNINSAPPISGKNEEWTELIVTADNVDLRNWSIRDNSQTGTTASWQAAISFRNIPFWQHVRRGTIIMLWSRDVNSFGNPHPVDSIAADGYLELPLYIAGTVLNSTNPYFTQGDNASSMDLSVSNANGDCIELLDGSGNHIHGFGHGTVAGGTAAWLAMPTPKLMHSANPASGEAVSACPAGNVAGFNGPPGTVLTSNSSTATTFGLPNTCASSSTANAAFWKALRQPDFTTQTVNYSSIIGGMPGSLTFSWTPVTDPYTADSTIGYLILRNTANSFLATPSDGTTYTVGNVIGGANVVAVIKGSATTTFTDNTVTNGNKYWYQVFAFRYTADNDKGTGTPFPALTDSTARGRAYNENNFVSVNWVGNPLPVNLLSFKAEKYTDKNHLVWVTSSEQENDYFLVEKSRDGQSFETIGKVKGAGTSTVVNRYSLDDAQPQPGMNYYGLIQVDRDGTQSPRKIVAVNNNGLHDWQFSVYPNPSTGIYQFDCAAYKDGDLSVQVYNCVGQLVHQERMNVVNGFNHYELNLGYLSTGTYFLKATSEGETINLRLLKD